MRRGIVLESWNWVLIMSRRCFAEVKQELGWETIRKLTKVCMVYLNDFLQLISSRHFKSTQGRTVQSISTTGVEKGCESDWGGKVQGYTYHFLKPFEHPLPNEFCRNLIKSLLSLQCKLRWILHWQVNVVAFLYRSLNLHQQLYHPLCWNVRSLLSWNHLLELCNLQHRSPELISWNQYPLVLWSRSLCLRRRISLMALRLKVNPLPLPHFLYLQMVHPN